MIICPKCKKGADISDENVEQIGREAETVRFQHIVCPPEKKK